MISAILRTEKGRCGAEVALYKAKAYQIPPPEISNGVLDDKRASWPESNDLIDSSEVTPIVAVIL